MMSRWIIKHARILFIALFVVFCAVAAVLMGGFGWNPIAVFIIAFIFFLLIYVFYYHLINEVLKKGIIACEYYCDPESFVGVTEELLSYGIGGWIRQIVLIDYYDALRWSGQYEKTYELLKGVNIDKEAGTDLSTKAVYYYNLADICTQVGKYDEADIWYNKMQQIYCDIKNDKIKQMHKHIITCGQAYAYYRKGEYESTVETVSELNRLLAQENKNESAKQKNNMLIDNKLLLSKAYIKLGKIDSAKEELRYIINYGNKLHAVVEAREMLLKIG